MLPMVSVRAWVRWYGSTPPERWYSGLVRVEMKQHPTAMEGVV